MKKKRDLLTLFLVVATELIGFGLIIPILPQLSTQLNVDRFWIGVLMASYSLAQFLAAPILGGLSDRFGRKPLLIISKMGTCLSYVLLALSQNYILFLIARLLDGFTGGNIAIARAYVADVTTPEDRPKGMAIIGISFGTGFILGPALGGWLYGLDDGHFFPALVAGGLSFIALLLTVFILREPEKKSLRTSLSLMSSIRLVLSTKTLLIFFAIQLLYMMAFSGFETSFSVFTSDRFGFDEQQNSWLFVYAGLLALFIQGYITRKSSRAVGRAIVFGLTLCSLGFLTMSVSSELWILLASLAIFSLGIGLSNTYLPALLSVIPSDCDEGVRMGVFESISSLGRVLGPLFAYLAIFSTLDQLYLAYASVLVLLALLSLVIFGQSRTDNEATHA